MSLAIFDLDNTLIAGDSDHAWGEFLIAKGMVDGPAYKATNDRFYQDYKDGTLDIFAYQAFAMIPLSQHSAAQLTAWHREFMTLVIAPMRLAKAEALLAKHRQAGDTLVIITATNNFVTAPIAASLGVDHLLATVAEQIDGRYTGRVAGTPCYQGGKVVRLRQWLQESQHSLTGSFFYSDSHNDLPLLEVVDHPVAVDPDPILRQRAEARGWPVISLR